MLTAQEHIEKAESLLRQARAGGSYAATVAYVAQTHLMAAAVINGGPLTITLGKP